LRDPELEIRLRHKGRGHFITIKCGHGRSRLEEEIPIPRESFEALWPLTRGARISKTRYRIPHQNRIIEMDVYSGLHRGLLTADVEFDSKGESGRFRPPDWLGREITGDPRYTNRTLARRVRRA